MAPNYSDNIEEKRNENEEQDQPTETTSLLAPALDPQVLPSTPTLGTSLSTPWRNHQGSAPCSPCLGGARSLAVSPQLPHKHQHHGRRTKHRSRSKSPTPSSRRSIRWIGVNGVRDRHHHHPLSSSSIDVGSSHYRNESSPQTPQTPHIIVSPECETQEPFFIYPEGASGTQIKRDQNDEYVEDGQISISGDVSKRDSSDKETGTYGNRNSFSPESPTQIGPEILMNEASITEAQINRSNQKIPSYLQYSADSSSSNSPEEERGQKFFGNELAVVEHGGQLGYHTRCNTLPHSRTDNNLPIVPSFHRSSSMVSLDPSDPNFRKTRRNSKMDMMRRVSSNSGLELRPPCMERTVSRISLATIVNNSNNNNSIEWQEQMNDSLILCVSALYAKLLVVMGMAFPMAEIISNDVPLILYHSFYLYLYFGSILFLIYAYIFLLRTKTISSNAIKHQMQSIKTKMPRLEVNWDALPKPFRDVLPKKKKEPDAKLADKADKISVATSAYKPPKYTITESNNHGSMYLKMGAVLFGIGSMIYSGLEFGQYFELRADEDCANILMAISPIARMIFTFLQMYFIFLNSRVAISKHTTIARFGFMHMIGTNLCIWLNVLVQETKHEIAHLTHSAGEHHADLFPGHSVESHTNENAVLGSHSSGSHDKHHTIDHDHHGDHALIDSFYNKSDTAHNIVRRSVENLDGCRRINLMGNVVSSASPFLFPCTIEYSLLCAGVLYVMWKNINIRKNEKNITDGDSDISTFIARKVRHHYSVDCARASRGLFTGIFILVLTIISLILFYVLISNENFKSFAILEANIIELSIYSLAIISVIIGMKQMRELEFILEGDIELDNILLIIAQAGVYIYASFTIIGGYFSLQSSHTLPLLTAILTLLQTTLQTLFILDGSRRCCSTADQLDRKPGREMVTFLLVCNLAMWAISTFETSRADVHPTQLHFYGIWAWTIISHVSMPLAIFYRFHVTVCLGEIWKRSYKLKQEFIGL